jgi:uncharacterized membrane protein
MKTHRNYYPLLLLAVTGIGLFLRVRHLNHHSLWLDEMMQVVVASAKWENLFSLVSLHSSPPLDYILLKCVVTLVGTADWVVRMPALLFGTACVPIFYVLVVKLTNRQHALIAATVLAFSPMAILYAQEARMYSLFLLLSLISYMATWRFVERNDFKSCVLLGAVNGLLILTHYFGIFVISLETGLLIALLLFNAGGKRRAALTALNLLVSFILFLPWLPTFLSGQIDMEIPYALGTGRFFLKTILSYFTTMGGKPDAWYYSYVLAFMAGAMLAFRANEKRVMIVAAGMVGMLGMLFGLAFFKRIITERNLIFLLPLFLVVCSYGMSTFLAYLKIPPAVGALIVALLLVWPGTRDHIAYRKVNWRGAARYIQQSLGSDEKIITTDFISRASLAYYLDPEEEYGLMRSRWRDITNDPEWKIWVINDELINKIEEHRFSGWAVIPPVTFQLVSAQTLDRYNRMMGQPVKQFQLGARSLNIYYLGSTKH